MSELEEMELAEAMLEERDLDVIETEILWYKQQAGTAILEIGARLIEAKRQLGHGEWIAWLRDKVDFSDRSAQNFMRLAKEYRNPQTVADLGASKALALLALPESEREEFLSEKHQVNGEEKTVIDMTSRELEKAIRERDAAQEARQAMEKSLKAANACMNRAKIEMEQAADRANELEKQLAELKAAPVEVAVMEVDQAAIEKARAEGESAKAQELAELQDQLDKAKDAREKAEEKRKKAESALADARARLDKEEKERKSADAMADPDVAMLKVCYEQEKSTFNVMKGLLRKFQNRGDKENAEKTKRIMCAIGSAYGEAIK